MKKILPLLLLFVLILPGCGSRTNTCPLNGLTPYATYLIIIDLGNGKFEQFTRAANANGTITVTTKAPSCNNIMFVLQTNFNLTLSASPSSIDLLSPASTVT